MSITKYHRGDAATLTVQQVMKELGMSNYMVRLLLKEGRIHGIKFGKITMIPRVALDELLRGEPAK